MTKSKTTLIQKPPPKKKRILSNDRPIMFTYDMENPNSLKSHRLLRKKDTVREQNGDL